MWPQDEQLRHSAFALYDSVWNFLSPGIRRARDWGSDWFEFSTPFLVVEDSKVLAHVGVVTCEFAIDGRPVEVAGLHAVLVHPDHRGRGLGRKVVEDAIDWVDHSGRPTAILWSEKVDFYGRFGFEPVREAIFRGVAPAALATEAMLLEPGQRRDLAILKQCLARREPISGIAAGADRGWHFLINLGLYDGEDGDLLYLPRHEAIAVLEVEDGTLRLYDLLCEKIPPIAAVVGAATSHYGEAIDALEVHFTPDRLDIALEGAIEDTEDLLQVRGQPLPGLGDRLFAFSPFTRT